MADFFCDEHYSYECGCEGVRDRVPPSLPPYVWVVVEVYTKAVQISRGPATGQVSGKAAIFAKPEVVEQTAARIVGVFDSEEAARAVERFGDEGTEYLVERHDVKVRFKLDPKPRAVDLERHGFCVTCHAPAANTFCDACANERLREMRERDGDIIAEQQPVIKSTFEFAHPLPAHA